MSKHNPEIPTKLQFSGPLEHGIDLRNTELKLWLTNIMEKIVMVIILMAAYGE